MSMTIEGQLSVEQMLLRLDVEGKRRVVSVLYKQAREIRDLARLMAPIDDGDLEKGIKIRPEQLGRIRDTFGRFTKTEVEVFIDLNMPIAARPGKTLRNYAYEIHEHLTPYGTKQLGPKSQLKQSGSSVIVGGGFLERAAEEIESQLDNALLDVLRDLD